MQSALNPTHTYGIATRTITMKKKKIPESEDSDKTGTRPEIVLCLSSEREFFYRMRIIYLPGKWEPNYLTRRSNQKK
jgi:hypothetical protein